MDCFNSAPNVCMPTGGDKECDKTHHLDDNKDYDEDDGHNDH